MPCARLRGEQGAGRPPAGDKPELLDISLPKWGDHVGMSSSPFQETSRRLQWRGMFLVLAASLLWGTTGTAQSLAPGGLSSLWIGAGRLAVAALFFVGLHAVTQRKVVEGPLATGMAGHWPAVVLAAGCMAVYNLAFFAGVKATSVAIGTALAIGSGPVWAGLLQWLVTGRAPTSLWWLGTGLAVGGGTLMVLSTSNQVAYSLVGVTLCLLAGLSYAGYTLANKRLASRVAPSLANAWVFGLAMTMALPAAVAWAPLVRVTSSDFWLLVYLGVVTTGVSYALFTQGLRYIAGATGVALALGEPVTAFVLAILVVGERPGLWAMGGMLLVLMGLAVVMRAELRSPLSR